MRHELLGSLAFVWFTYCVRRGAEFKIVNSYKSLLEALLRAKSTLKRQARLKTRHYVDDRGRG
ncbi:hypothetical protein O9992_26625 [Vibrio lentus]|nr:hypothetical protein [Vibrio lentus]